MPDLGMGNSSFRSFTRHRKHGAPLPTTCDMLANHQTGFG